MLFLLLFSIELSGPIDGYYYSQDPLMLAKGHQAQALANLLETYINKLPEGYVIPSQQKNIDDLLVAGYKDFGDGRIFLRVKKTGQVSQQKSTVEEFYRIVIYGHFNKKTDQIELDADNKKLVHDLLSKTNETDITKLAQTYKTLKTEEQAVPLFNPSDFFQTPITISDQEVFDNYCYGIKDDENTIAIHEKQAFEKYVRPFAEDHPFYKERVIKNKTAITEFFNKVRDKLGYNFEAFYKKPESNKDIFTAWANGCRAFHKNLDAYTDDFNDQINRSAHQRAYQKFQEYCKNMASNLQTSIISDEDRRWLQEQWHLEESTQSLQAIQDLIDNIKKKKEAIKTTYGIVWRKENGPDAFGTIYLLDTEIDNFLNPLIEVLEKKKQDIETKESIKKSNFAEILNGFPPATQEDRFDFVDFLNNKQLHQVFTAWKTGLELKNKAMQTIFVLRAPYAKRATNAYQGLVAFCQSIIQDIIDNQKFIKNHNDQYIDDKTWRNDMTMKIQQELGSKTKKNLPTYYEDLHKKIKDAKAFFGISNIDVTEDDEIKEWKQKLNRAINTFFAPLILLFNSEKEQIEKAKEIQAFAPQATIKEVLGFTTYELVYEKLPWNYEDTPLTFKKSCEELENAKNDALKKLENPYIPENIKDINREIINNIYNKARQDLGLDDIRIFAYPWVGRAVFDLNFGWPEASRIYEKLKTEEEEKYATDKKEIENKQNAEIKRINGTYQTSSIRLVNSDSETRESINKMYTQQLTDLEKTHKIKLRQLAHQYILYTDHCINMLKTITEEKQFVWDETSGAYINGTNWLNTTKTELEQIQDEDLLRNWEQKIFKLKTKAQKDYHTSNFAPQDKISDWYTINTEKQKLYGEINAFFQKLVDIINLKLSELQKQAQEFTIPIINPRTKTTMNSVEFFAYRHEENPNGKEMNSVGSFSYYQVKNPHGTEQINTIIGFTIKTLEDLKNPLLTIKNLQVLQNRYTQKYQEMLEKHVHEFAKKHPNHAGIEKNRKLIQERFDEINNIIEERMKLFAPISPAELAKDPLEFFGSYQDGTKYRRLEDLNQASTNYMVDELIQHFTKQKNEKLKQHLGDNNTKIIEEKYQQIKNKLEKIKQNLETTCIPTNESSKNPVEFFAKLFVNDDVNGTDIHPISGAKGFLIQQIDDLDKIKNLQDLEILLQQYTAKKEEKIKKYVTDIRAKCPNAPTIQKNQEIIEQKFALVHAKIHSQISQAQSQRFLGNVSERWAENIDIFGPAPDQLCFVANDITKTLKTLLPIAQKFKALSDAIDDSTSKEKTILNHNRTLLEQQYNEFLIKSLRNSNIIVTPHFIKENIKLDTFKTSQALQKEIQRQDDYKKTLSKLWAPQGQAGDENLLKQAIVNRIGDIYDLFLRKAEPKLQELKRQEQAKTAKQQTETWRTILSDEEVKFLKDYHLDISDKEQYSNIKNFTTALKRRMINVHPDKGGDVEKCKKFNSILEKLNKHI